VLIRNQKNFGSWRNSMALKRTVDVNTGEIHLEKADAILRSVALGSCIAVVVYDKKEKIGAIAHIMLPGIAPANSMEKYKYAPNAVVAVLTMMAEAGSQKSNINACIVGAGNVLEKQDDTICASNIKSVTQLLKDNNIPVKASVVGGIERKGVFLDVETGNISYTIGNSGKKKLWQP